MRDRSPFEDRAVESRRGGPSKAPLSREAIVREALRLLTTEGLRGMSLRKVAAALDTGPSTLYAYVDDLDALRALVLDHALTGVDTTRTSGADFRTALRAVLRSYAGVLAGSPGLAQLAFGAVAVGPNALRITEVLLGLLAEGGVDPATAAWSVDLLILHVTAVVAEHADGLDPAAPSGSVAHAIDGVSAADYPQVHAVRAQLLSGTAEQRFEWAVEVLLRGILQTPVPR